MAEDPLCPRCSEPLPPGEAECPYCARRKPYPIFHREPVLLAAMATLAVFLWLVTHGVTQAYGHRQDHLARTWYAMGDAALREGRVDVAIADLRSALAYSHDGANVRLRLAEALAANGQVRQAQAYLLALWEEQPGDANVSLQLARLAVRAGNLTDAQRYYHNSIYGVWEEDPIARRRNARLELAHFLLQSRSPQQAESELIALAADMPKEPKWALEVGQLFLQTGDMNRALAEFSEVLKAQPRNGAALAGAGQAAFQLQDYSLARRYLEGAVALDRNDSSSAQLLTIANLVNDGDPFVARIGREERSRRVLQALEQTRARLEACAKQQQIALDSQPTASPIAADYLELEALGPRAGMRALREDRDLTDTAMQLVFRSQADAASVCGPPEGPDLALLLIGRAHGGRP